jgi:ribosomal protein L7/L12
MARRALIVANGVFEDTSIAPLRSPVPDAERLRALLEREDVGSYEVTLCRNVKSTDARRQVQLFFNRARHDDFHFVLITGHGIKDRWGKLHFATADTHIDALSATSLEARFVMERMDESEAVQQLLFLDTCYSGAFQKGLVHKAGLASVSRDDFGNDDSSGKAVITATTAIQLAGERESGNAAQSIFTRHLIDGIESGAADPGATGRITLDELFRHIRTGMRADGCGQTPQPFYFGLSGTVVVALNPALRRRGLADDLSIRLASEDRQVRGYAVEDLFGVALDQGPGAADARSILSRVAKDDESLFVRHLARDALERLDEASAPADPIGPPAIDPAQSASRIEVAEDSANGSSVEAGAAQVSPLSALDRSRVRIVALIRAPAARLATVLRAPQARLGRIVQPSPEQLTFPLAAHRSVETATADVILAANNGRMINLTKEVMAIADLGLGDALALVRRAPTAVKEGVSPAEAKDIKMRLEEAGGTVELK